MPTRKPMGLRTPAQAIVGQEMHQTDIARRAKQSTKYVSQQLRYELPLTKPVIEAIASVAGYEVAGEVTRLCREAQEAKKVSS